MRVRAEAFHVARRLGNDEQYISTVDADGVALAATPGSSEKGTPEKARIDDLESEREAIKERLSALEAADQSDSLPAGWPDSVLTFVVIALIGAILGAWLRPRLTA